MRTAALAGLLAGVIVLRGLLQVAASWVAIALPIGVQARLSSATYDTMLDTGLEFFARNDGGILRTLVIDYPQRLASAIKSITDVIANVLLAVIYAALMLAVSWRITLVAIVLVGTLGWASNICSRFRSAAPARRCRPGRNVGTRSSTKPGWASSSSDCWEPSRCCGDPISR